MDFVFEEQSNPPFFSCSEEGTVIGSNKAYIPAEWAKTTVAHLSLITDTSRMKSLETLLDERTERYNIQGQRVDQAFKGIVIVGDMKRQKKFQLIHSK